MTNKISVRLEDEVFELFAANHYTNMVCGSVDEFIEDLELFVTVKRMLTRYVTGSTVNLRLLMNNFIRIYNVFDSDAATVMLFFRIDTENLPYLKTILSYLNLIPKHYFEYTDTLNNDEELLELLRQSTQ